MKNIIIKLVNLLIFSGLLIFASCENEFLNQEPNDSVDISKSITNENQLLIAMNGVYDAMQSSRSFGNNIITSQALLGDNGFVTLKNSNRWVDYNQYLHAIPENGNVYNMWQSLYRVIGRANNIIAYEGKIVDDPSVEGDPKNIFAEAKIARAFAYFELVNYFSRPVGTTSQDLGVVLSLVLSPEQELPRSSVSEVYGQIEKDLAEAMTVLEGKNTGKIRLGYDASALLMSRVKLYKKDYSGSIEYSDIVLNSSFSSLLTKDKVEGYYKKENAPETIFEISYGANDNPGSNDALTATWGTGSTYKQNFATSEFYNIIPDTDERKKLYKVANNFEDNPKPVNVGKFISNDHNLVHLRKTEAILNKIESMYFVNEGNARDALNSWVSTYRDEAYSTTASGQDLLNEILNQRRIELAFEGHRYFDLNRYQLPVKKGNNCTNNCEVSFGDFKRVFPIPRHEIRSNTKVVQNPGY